MQINQVGHAYATRWTNVLALVVVAGVSGQIGDGLSINETAAAAVHALFGLLLCLAVTWQFHDTIRRSGDSPGTPQLDISHLVRSLSRHVYLLLYLLFGIRQVINNGIYLRQRESLLGHAVPLSHEVSPVYLYYGLIAVAGIRLLAFHHVHRRRPSDVGIESFQTTDPSIHAKVRYTL